VVACFVAFWIAGGVASAAATAPLVSLVVPRRLI